LAEDHPRIIPVRLSPVSDFRGDVDRRQQRMGHNGLPRALCAQQIFLACVCSVNA